MKVHRPGKMTNDTFICSGYITKSEFIKLSKNLSREQVEKAFAKFDKDGDGRLDIKEFKKMMDK